MDRTDIKDILVVHFYFVLIMLSIIILCLVCNASLHPLGAIFLDAEGVLIVIIIGMIGTKYIERVADNIADKLEEKGFL